ncbi:MAG: aminotransferase class IV [Myxococcales bacterium]
MQAIACIDGKLSPLDQALVPVVDRGFLYGDAVFEALRTFGGEPDGLERHLARLERSCGILGIELGVPQTQVASEVRLALAQVEGPEAYIRIMVTRGDHPETLAPRGARSARRVILVRTLHPTSATEVGVIRLRSCVAPPSALWAGAKPSAYINNLLAIAQAQGEGADDALLLGAHGELLEGATSSLFLVDAAGEIFTPPVALGILPGITRDRVLACARLLGIPARERLLTVHDAYRASELFMTSSVRGIVGVSELDGRSVGGAGGAAGAITRRVFDRYHVEVAGGFSSLG